MKLGVRVYSALLIIRGFQGLFCRETVFVLRYLSLNSTVVLLSRLLLIVSLILASVFVNADVFIREYTYRASENDSKVTARKHALDHLKAQVLQEVGTNLHHVITARRDGSGARSEQEVLRVVTAGLSSIVVLKEYWNGESFYVKARISVDTSQVLNTLHQQRIRDDQLEQQQRLIERQQQALEQLQADVKRLNQVVHTSPPKRSAVTNKPSGEVLPVASLLPLLGQKKGAENMAAPSDDKGSMAGLAGHIPLGLSHPKTQAQRLSVPSDQSMIQHLLVRNPLDEMMVVRFWPPGQNTAVKSFFIPAHGDVKIDQIKSRVIANDWKVDVTKPQHQPVALFSVTQQFADKDVWLLDLGRLKRFVQRHRKNLR